MSEIRVIIGVVLLASVLLIPLFSLFVIWLLLLLFFLFLLLLLLRFLVRWQLLLLLHTCLWTHWLQRFSFTISSLSYSTCCYLFFLHELLEQFWIFDLIELCTTNTNCPNCNLRWLLLLYRRWLLLLYWLRQFLILLKCGKLFLPFFDCHKFLWLINMKELLIIL